MADFPKPPRGAGPKFVRRSSRFTGLVGTAAAVLMVYSQWEMWRMRSDQPHPIDEVTVQNVQRSRAEREAIAQHHAERRQAEALRMKLAQDEAKRAAAQQKASQ